MSTSKKRHAAPLGMLLGMAAILAIGLPLAGCGSATSGNGSSTAAPSPSASAPASPTEATPSPITSATPLCTAATLTGMLDSSGGGAAGSVYMKLIVTNNGATGCILDGYPGVSLVKAGSAEPIGAPAERDTATPSQGPISLVPGASATAVLRYTQADNYQDCQREQADAVLVYPPSATDSLEIRNPLMACSNTNVTLLRIGAFQP